VRRALFGLLPALAGCAALSGAPSLDDAQQVVAALKFPGSGAPSDLTVTGNFDRPDGGYSTGAPIAITVTASEPASIAVLRVLHNGETTIVFPNKTQPDAHAANGTIRVTIPAGPEGAELFEFLAAANGGSAWIFTRKPAAPSDYADLGSTTRAIITDLQTTFKGAPHGTVAVSHGAISVGG
jgi:hypothetical protein